MQWKFWKRKKGKEDSAAKRDAAPQDANPRFPLLTTSSATELLGLQRLIGNQAVLRMVNPTSPGRTSTCDP